MAIFIDAALCLNTAKLSEGKSLKTRRALLTDYLHKESYIDLVTIIYIVVENSGPVEELEITMHVLLLVALAIRISRKSDSLRTFFAFKKYISMIDSVLLLLIFGHLSVSILLCRLSFYSYLQSSFRSSAGCSTLVSLTTQNGVLSILTILSSDDDCHSRIRRYHSPE